MDFCNKALESRRHCRRPEDYLLISNGHPFCPNCEGRGEKNPGRELASECRGLLEYLAREIRQYNNHNNEGNGPSAWPDCIEKCLATIDENARSAGPNSRYYEEISSLYAAELGPGEARLLYAFQGWERRQREEAANNSGKGSGMAALIRRTRQRWGQGRRLAIYGLCWSFLCVKLWPSAFL